MDITGLAFFTEAKITTAQQPTVRHLTPTIIQIQKDFIPSEKHCWRCGMNVKLKTSCHENLRFHPLFRRLRGMLCSPIPIFHSSACNRRVIGDCRLFVTLFFTKKQILKMKILNRALYHIVGMAGILAMLLGALTVCAAVEFIFLAVLDCLHFVLSFIF
jgi:hypothetical protein